jgi:hypothetical protein
MDRRAFLAGAAGLLAAPPAAEAQPAGKVPRVEWLQPPVTSPSASRRTSSPGVCRGHAFNTHGLTFAQQELERLPADHGLAEAGPGRVPQ